MKKNKIDKKISNGIIVEYILKKSLNRITVIIFLTFLRVIMFHNLKIYQNISNLSIFIYNIFINIYSFLNNLIFLFTTRARTNKRKKMQLIFAISLMASMLEIASCTIQDCNSGKVKVFYLSAKFAITSFVI